MRQPAATHSARSAATVTRPPGQAWTPSCAQLPVWKSALNPLLGFGREERLWAATGHVAVQAVQDQGPRLRGVTEVHLGVALAEAVVPEQDAGSGCGPAGVAQLPFPGRALPEWEARGDAHADELARLGDHVRHQVHRCLREAEPGPVGGHVAVGGPERPLSPGGGQSLEDAGPVRLDVGGEGDRSVHGMLPAVSVCTECYFSSI